MSALIDRDTNQQPTSHPTNSDKHAASGEENKPQETQQHKYMLDSKIGEHNGKSYISPSDAILSPASQKLAGYKQKKIQGSRKPAARTLFARNASSCSSGFDDMDVEADKQ